MSDEESAERFEELLFSYNFLDELSCNVVVFDAARLEYISSAGLRTLLKIRKAVDKKIDIINVNDSVFDVLMTSGFNELFRVSKPLCEVPVKGCPVICTNNNYTLYRLDYETIVKVFNKRALTLDEAEKEQTLEREAFSHGLPVVKPYDLVRADNNYGIVYGITDAMSLSSALKEYPDRLEELSMKAGSLFRKLHSVEMESSLLPSALKQWKDLAYTLCRFDYISKTENEMICGILSRIPDRKNLIHNNFYPNNIIVHEDSLLLIDFQNAAVGHPIADLSSLYFSCMLSSSLGMSVEDETGLSEETMHEVWHGMMRAYFGTSNSEMLNEYDANINSFAQLRMLEVVDRKMLLDWRESELWESKLMEAVKHLESVGETLKPLDIL